MLKLFISHAWEDNEIARKTAISLQQDGFETWSYYNKIVVGNGGLPEIINKAIQWCDVFILEWSKFSDKTKCMSLEWQKAKSLRKPIILCLLDRTKPSEISSKYLSLNFNSFSVGYNFLLQKLQSEVGAIQPNLEMGSKTTAAGHSIFRSQAKKLSEDDVDYMLKSYNFFDRNKNKQGSGFDNQFDGQEINGFQVILDHRAGLMWQQSGSQNSMWFDQAKTWIARLNQEQHAGYRDWRMPTLEEAMSLVERKNGSSGELFINPRFCQKQGGIWTSDLMGSGSMVWVVFFHSGSCYANCHDLDNYVIAVRNFH